MHKWFAGLSSWAVELITMKQSGLNWGHGSKEHVKAIPNPCGKTKHAPVLGWIETFPNLMLRCMGWDGKIMASSKGLNLWGDVWKVGSEKPSEASLKWKPEWGLTEQQLNHMEWELASAWSHTTVCQHTKKQIINSKGYKDKCNPLLCMCANFPQMVHVISCLKSRMEHLIIHCGWKGSERSAFCDPEGYKERKKMQKQWEGQAWQPLFQFCMKARHVESHHSQQGAWFPGGDALISWQYDTSHWHEGELI